MNRSNGQKQQQSQADQNTAAALHTITKQPKKKTAAVLSKSYLICLYQNQSKTNHSFINGPYVIVTYYCGLELGSSLNEHNHIVAGSY